MRRLGPFFAVDLLEQIDDPEFAAEVIELYSHALAMDRLARERLGA